MSEQKKIAEQTERTLQKLVDAGQVLVLLRGIRFPSQVPVRAALAYYLGPFNQPCRGVPGNKRNVTGSVKVRVYGKRDDENVTFDMAELMDAVADQLAADFGNFRTLVPSVYFDAISGEGVVDEESGEAIGLVTLEYAYTKR